MLFVVFKMSKCNSCILLLFQFVVGICLIFVEFNMAIIIFIISSQSTIKDFAIFTSKSSMSLSSLNQYPVSLASLYAISNLSANSFRDDPPTGSSTLAPMEVPLFNNCTHKSLSTFIFRSA